MFKVLPFHYEHFNGQDEYNFGNLTYEHLSDAQLRDFLLEMAIEAVTLHFVKEVGALLIIHRPLSLEWKMMLALWTNYDEEEKFAVFKATNSWKKVYWFIEDALNECLPPGVERRTSLQWWWTFDSDLVSLASDLQCCSC